MSPHTSHLELGSECVRGEGRLGGGLCAEGGELELSGKGGGWEIVLRGRGCAWDLPTGLRCSRYLRTGEAIAACWGPRGRRRCQISWGEATVSRGEAPGGEGVKPQEGGKAPEEGYPPGAVCVICPHSEHRVPCPPPRLVPTQGNSLLLLPAKGAAL